MNRQESKRVLLMLTAAYPNTNMPAQTHELYIRCLADLPADLAEAAILDVITSCKFLPTIAELREAAARLNMTALPADAEAWAEVLAAVNKYHYNGKPEFSHPAIERAVRGVGWQTICLSEQIGVERAHFFRLYGQVCDRERADARMLPQVRALAASLDTGRRALPEPEG